MQKTGYLGLWQYGTGRYQVFLAVYGSGGRGLCAFLYGGERPHTGGAAYAVPRPRSDGQGVTADISTICAPGHKDVRAAEAIAKALCIPTQEDISLTAGIHIDQANQAEIQLLLKNCQAVANQFIQDYCTATNQNR